MDGKIVVEEKFLNDFKLRLIQVGANLSEVTNGAYLTQDMFLKSQSRTADAMNEVLPVLVQCAEAMYNCCISMAAFFQRVIADTDQWDYEMALKSYMLGVQNTVTQKVIDREDYHAPNPPTDADLDAYNWGQEQGVQGQIPNRPK